MVKKKGGASMKKIIAILLLSLVVLSSFALYSCDQEEVDAKRDEIMDKASDALGPFFEEASESSTNNAQDDKDKEQK